MAISKYLYPLTPQQEAATVMLGGNLPDNRLHPDRDRMTRMTRLYGTGREGLDKLTPGDIGVAPWARANRSKKQPLFDQGAVRSALSQPRTEANIKPTDPMQLHSTQPNVTRGGVDYYLGDEYSRTGKTYADQGNAGNAIPVIYNKEDGRRLILSGHHRASAALLEGRQFDGLQVFGP